MDKKTSVTSDNLTDNIQNLLTEAQDRLNVFVAIFNPASVTGDNRKEIKEIKQKITAANKILNPPASRLGKSLPQAPLDASSRETLAAKANSVTQQLSKATKLLDAEGGDVYESIIDYKIENIKALLAAKNSDASFIKYRSQYTYSGDKNPASFDLLVSVAAGKIVDDLNGLKQKVASIPAAERKSEVFNAVREADKQVGEILKDIIETMSARSRELGIKNQELIAQNNKLQKRAKIKNIIFAGAAVVAAAIIIGTSISSQMTSKKQNTIINEQKGHIDSMTENTKLQDAFNGYKTERTKVISKLAGIQEDIDILKGINKDSLTEAAQDFQVRYNAIYSQVLGDAEYLGTKLNLGDKIDNKNTVTGYHKVAEAIVSLNDGPLSELDSDIGDFIKEALKDTDVSLSSLYFSKMDTVNEKMNEINSTLNDLATVVYELPESFGTTYEQLAAEESGFASRYSAIYIDFLNLNPEENINNIYINAIYDLNKLYGDLQEYEDRISIFKTSVEEYVASDEQTSGGAPISGAKKSHQEEDTSILEPVGDGNFEPVDDRDNRLREDFPEIEYGRD